MTAPTTIDPLDALEARHVAFLHERLVGEVAAAEWRANLAGVKDALLAAKVGEVVDPNALADALDAALTGEAVERVAGPLARALIPRILAELEADRTRVGDHVPAVARARLEALLARPGLVPERLLREIAAQEAIEEVVRDVMFDGFKEFSERVNPFTAEWGIPSLLKRVSLLGGAMSKGIDVVKAEFDRRLEPELRRYLATFSRRGLGRMVDVTIARSDEPASIAVRRHLLAWALEQPLATLARESDPEAIRVATEIGLDITGAALDRAEVRGRRRASIAEVVRGAEGLSVAEALTALGITVVVDDASLAAATWPVVRAALASPAVSRWIAGLAHEFYAAERARLPPA